MIFVLPIFIRGKFHIDPENLSPWVEWGQKVVQSVNDPSHNLLIIDQATVDGSMRWLTLA